MNDEEDAKLNGGEDVKEQQVETIGRDFILFSSEDSQIYLDVELVRHRAVRPVRQCLLFYFWGLQSLGDGSLGGEMGDSIRVGGVEES